MAELQMTETYCIWCKKSLKEQMIYALLIDLGCKSSVDPVACYASPTGEHEFLTTKHPEKVDDNDG